MDKKSRVAALLILWLGLFLSAFTNGKAEKKVVCYYTNWSVYRPGTAKFSPQNINPYLCTHLIYAFGGFTKDNTLKPFDKYQDIEKGGYAKFNGLKTYNKKLKTLLAIGGWNEGSSRFSPMVADPKRRRQFVKNCVKFLRQNFFDGLDLDWEYPAFRDGGKPRDKNNYADLVQELRQQFEKEAAKTGKPRLLLTMAMPAGIEYIDKGYDVPRLNEHLDFINLLTYDYHSAYEPAVNHHSPLFPLEEDNEYNYDSELTIDYTINYLIKQGASAEKLILGIPTYGRSYTLINEDATDIGSPADGPGVEGDATREKGYLAYYEICQNIKKDDWEVIKLNPDAMGPYAFKGNQWVGYDDESIVQKKSVYVNTNNLGGIMFWSIDNDDFRGTCHGKPYPLIEAAKEALFTGVVKESPVKTTRLKIRNNLKEKNSKTSRRTTEAPDDDDDEDNESEDDEEVVNVVKEVVKPSRSKSIARKQSPNRRKQAHQQDNKPAEAKISNNHLTTPEPPTTPDPGSDFKCEDEGFFSHPRDCKKYFWCLDSGPSGLGVVAHAFTCPSGLVFNKAADSCDYPRNVICPKTKSSSSKASTTASPTTPKPVRITTEASEEVEYDDDDDDEEDEDDEDEVQEEVKPVTPKPIVTTKPLLYKTITRSKPTTSTTTTTSTTPPTTTEPARFFTPDDKVISSEDEEQDPRVLKELIDLIKKAGGLEQLEKQLNIQEKSKNVSESGQVSRSLYERVLNRQSGKNHFFNNRRNSNEENRSSGNSKTEYVNGPGRSQFEGLEEVPEVKTIRRTNQYQYVNIKRDRNQPEEEEDLPEEEKTDYHQSKEVYEPVEVTTKKAAKEKVLSPKVTPSYSNIRRIHPTTSIISDSDVRDVHNPSTIDKLASRRRRPIAPKVEEASPGQETTKIMRRRPGILNRQSSHHVDKKPNSDGEHSDHSNKNVPSSTEDQQTTKSRYISIQRFRSTSQKPNEPPEPVDITPTSTSTTSTEKSVKISLNSLSRTETSIISTITSSATPIPITSPSITTTTNSKQLTDKPIPHELGPSTHIPDISSTKQSFFINDSKVFEDSTTAIVHPTSVAPDYFSQSPDPGTKVTVATVSQPRPFGFPRRTRPAQGSTSSLQELATESTRNKVTDQESVTLPTLMELLSVHDNLSSAEITGSLSAIEKHKKNGLIHQKDSLHDSESSNLGYNDQFKPALHVFMNHKNYTTKKETEDLSFYNDNLLTIKRNAYNTTETYDITEGTIGGGNTIQGSKTRRRMRVRSTTPSTSEITENYSAKLANNKRRRQHHSTSSSGTTIDSLPTKSLPTTTISSSEQDMDATQGFFITKTYETTVKTTIPDDEFNIDSLVTSNYMDASTESEHSSKSTSSHNTPTDMISSTQLPKSTENENDTSSTITIPTNQRNHKYSLTVPESYEQETFKESESNHFTTNSYDEAMIHLNINEATTIADFSKTPESSTIENLDTSTSKTTSTHNEAYTSSNFVNNSTQLSETEIEMNSETNATSMLGNDSLAPKNLNETGIISDETSKNSLNSNKTSEASYTTLISTSYTTQSPARIQTTRPSRNRSRFRGQSRFKYYSYNERSTVQSSTTSQSIDRGRKKGATLRIFGQAEEKTSNNDNQEQKERQYDSKVTNSSMKDAESSSTKAKVVPNSGTSRIKDVLNSKRQRFSTTSSPTVARSYNVATSDSLGDSRLDAAGINPITIEDIDEEEQKSLEAVDEDGDSISASSPSISSATLPGETTYRTTTPRKTIAKVTLSPEIKTTAKTARTPSWKKNNLKYDIKLTASNVIRPYQPAMIDYDYYEDENNHVNIKSALQGKLYITEKGNIQCLDQGNFPHPDSCKKFITCAKMVNGIVIGTEYTCPETLSFDPVGGLCNWSSDLGCYD